MRSRFIPGACKGLGTQAQKKENRQMVMIKTYTIKERRDGGSWKPLEHVKIYAVNWQEAKKEFTKWVLEWLGDRNQDEAIAAWDDLRNEYNSGKYIDTWHDDVFTYTIKAV